MTASTHGDVLNRIRAEYREMPGLNLTARQVQRLCDVDESMCRTVLDSLVALKILSQTTAGTYVASSAGPHARRPAKAGLPHARRSVVAKRLAV